MRARLIVPVFVLASLSLAGVAAQPAAAAWKALPQECALLDDDKTRGKMDGLLMQLLIACGREDELGQVRQQPGFVPDSPAGPGVPDVLVNDPTGDTGASTTQSETAITFSPVTGTYCAHYNDSASGLGGGGFTGFSRSTDGGATWDDRGDLTNGSGGDPTVVFRQADGNFYASSLRAGGLGVWRSTDDCQTFQYITDSSTGSDDKEIMAVDNTGGAFDGSLYIAWTDFGAGSQIYVTRSTDAGLTWSSQLALSAPGVDVQGAWPVVAPNGDVYVGWLRWNPFPSGNIDIEIAKSTDGGVTFALVTNPMTNQVNPRDSSATGNCGRPALNENIRYLPSPQLVFGEDGSLHVVYSYDPDGFDVGDVVDVFYRKSTDGGATWASEIQINDDATSNDQYFPTLSVGPGNIVSAAWYDRRLDAPNQLQDYYRSFSFDGGATWQPNERVSDVSSPIYIDPNLATCYHGDYDQQSQTGVAALIQWSDDRRMEGARFDPDVYFESVPVSTDFLLTGAPASQDICAPDDALYGIEVLQFQGFTEPVTLVAAGNPAGTAVAFGTNPVVPPGFSSMTVSGTGAASAGSYPIIVTGTSSPGAIVHDTTVTLNIFDQDPSTPTLISPPDAATDVDLRPMLDWTGALQASSYLVEVATDATFTNIVFSANTTDTTVVVDPPLDPVSQYWWHVVGINICGNGAFSTPFSFTTRPIPPVLLVDDDDNAPDVRIFYTDALTALGRAHDVWDTANSDNEPTAADLAPYETVIWFSGDEFGGAAGPGAAGEAALGTWLDAGGCLFLSSQDYHFDRGLTPFMQTYLGVASVDDDAGDYTSVEGQPGTLFASQGPYPLDYTTPGLGDFSDDMDPDASALTAFLGDNLNGAANEKQTVDFTNIYLVFPWPAISTSTTRETVLETFLNVCGADPLIFADGFESGDTSAWSNTVP